MDNKLFLAIFYSILNVRSLFLLSLILHDIMLWFSVLEIDNKLRIHDQFLIIIKLIKNLLLIKDWENAQLMMNIFSYLSFFISLRKD